MDRVRPSNLNNETFINFFTFQSSHYDLYVAECGYECCDPLHFWGPAPKSFHCIHYILSGHGTFKAGGRTWTLGPGDGFYTVPDVAIEYMASAQDPWEYRWVSFNGTQAQSIMRTSTVSPSSPVFHYDKDDLLSRMMSDMYQASLSKNNSDLLLTGHLYLFLAQFVNLFRNEENAAFETSKEYVTQALRYIAVHYPSTCTMEQLTRYLGLSRTYVYKIFMKHVGMSPTDYITHLRIGRAKELLESRRCTVSEVAREVGFEDPLYFSKVFKRIVGLAPAQYQKRQVQRADGAVRETTAP